MNPLPTLSCPASFPLRRPARRVAWWTACALALLLAVPAGAQPATSSEPPAADCGTPATLDDGWPRATPAEAGFDPAALCALLDGFERSGLNFHGIVVERHGRLVAERYRRQPDRPITTWWGLLNPVPSTTDFGPATRHDVRSISKSITGLLVGVLRQQGVPFDVRRPALEVFPELADLRGTPRDAITLEHLLTMTSGLDWEEGAFPNDEHAMFWRADVARLVLGRELVATPGTRWNYNGGGTWAIAEAVSRAADRPFTEVARTGLFEPLGITDIEWATDLRGRPMPFNGARLRPRDMARLGRLVLDGGRWQGRQIVDAGWIAESLTPRIATGGRLPDGSPVHYGYQWRVGSVDWRGRPVRWAGAFGNGGQRIVVLPELDTTLVITAGIYDSPAFIEATARLMLQLVAAHRE